MRLIDKIIDKIESSSVDWREEASGNRSLQIKQKDLDDIGKRTLLNEAAELEKAGLVRCKWFGAHTDIERISYSLDHQEALYHMAGRTPKSARIGACCEALRQEMDGIHKTWIRSHYQSLLDSIEQGREPEVLSPGSRDSYFACFSGLDQLTEPIYKRIFSKKYLGDSKLFERELESYAVSAARKYCDLVDENMKSQEVLTQLYIDDYATELALKGDLTIETDGRPIDLSAFRYGALLNSSMLKHTTIPAGQAIKKIITVENKANYMTIPYEEGSLIIFSHGYFSPLEREFLITLRQSLSSVETEYYHTGDLDYGGVRIFQYIQTSIFPALKPYQMDPETYDTYAAYGTPIEPSKLKKLKTLQYPPLQPLINRICQDGLGIEQESFLF